MTKDCSYEIFYRSLSVSALCVALPVKKETQQLSISLEPLLNIRWEKKIKLREHIEQRLKKFSQIKVTENSINILNTLPTKNYTKVIQSLDELWDEIAREGIFSSDIWPGQHLPPCSGFNEARADESSQLLSELYRDAFMVAEKKPFVVDLDASQGARLKSIASEATSFFDGAAQIASLALGYNDPLKNSMFMKPELLCEKQDSERSEITQAFSHLLRHESGLEHINLVNSGAEAVEMALRICQHHYPKRQRIFAFKGSFHGRTLLALHCTYNPAKREPYEIFKGLVEFFEFPEDKTPSEERHEPQGWLELWNEDNAERFNEMLSKMDKDVDEVIESEIQILKEIRKGLQNEEVLAFITEPMLCEGGDRYGSARFFRALRILTRLYETPLIMDEVQCGFGLGGEFFWHKKFHLQRVDGKADHPDCICLAKKAQVGACISNTKLGNTNETSLASLYRGYLQGQEVLRADIKLTERRTQRFLKLLSQHLAKGVLRNIRGVGLAFAFDLETGALATALVSARFKNGILFYPAGEKTLRFRLLLEASDEDLAELFTGIRKCFIQLEEQKLIAKGRSLKEWQQDLQKLAKPAELQKIVGTSFFEELAFPKTFAEVQNLDKKQWNRIFRRIARHCPQILFTESNQLFSLEKLKKTSIEELWQQYQNSDRFFYLDFLWQAARKMGHQVELLDIAGVKKLTQELHSLEERVYEPARRTDIAKLLEYAKDKTSIFLVSKNEEQKVQALCVGAPLNIFSEVGLVNTDSNRHQTSFLYGLDLTVDLAVQGKGLGFRLKCEQILQARALGAQCIRSRNRFPEASGMIHLNQRLGSLVIDELANAYGPSSSPAKYQSLRIVDAKTNLHLRDKRRGGLLNKGSLANFVSPQYINNALALKSALPGSMQHVFLTSGRAEGVDKIVKLLKEQRPEAHLCISIENDDFGDTTASARSLGGNGDNNYFDWPAFAFNSDFKDIENFLSSFGAKEILGFFVEPKCHLNGKVKEAAKLKKLVALMKKHGIPVIFHESGSAFGQLNPKCFLVAEKFGADMSYFLAAPQLGVVATRKAFFNEKPLMMISTWDGDEMGLHYLRQRLEKWAWA